MNKDPWSSLFFQSPSSPPLPTALEKQSLVQKALLPFHNGNGWGKELNTPCGSHLSHPAGISVLWVRVAALCTLLVMNWTGAEGDAARRGCGLETGRSRAVKSSCLLPPPPKAVRSRREKTPRVPALEKHRKGPEQLRSRLSVDS